LAANGNLSTTVSVTLVVTGSCAAIGDSWQSTAIASQSDIFTAQFDATPSVSPISSVVGLAPPGAGVVAIVQFDPSGNINAYDGRSGSYTAAAAIPYSAGQSYHFRLAVNLPANTYSIFVTPSGGSELVIGKDYLLRHPVTSLGQWSADSTPASTEVCNFTVL
jgi:hypothetical protein